MKRETKKNWCIVYRNELNQYHQEDDNPSVIYFMVILLFAKMVNGIVKANQV